MTTNNDQIRADQTAFSADEGFVRAVRPDVARRQLRVSLALAGVIALATAGVAASTTIQPRHTEQASIKVTVQSPGSVHVQQARIKRAPNGS